ncbi:hypothetical protein EV193_102186 [Herbihabitans rhizosphaerae]|uniref:Uncharacterized protein n=1 Tax=Herbihabitans rhizosphaerae TaxID=1872711 RepID=A0A4Q7L1Y3_9PSEU|nr:DUF5313 family protein [Herbihabitans rhizosphaerae]RZS43207.1 hypothetical protein EV193_102186 [Herbihabitans rhizosphaerae]
MWATRPGPVRWLWYAWGGRLPHAYREWVLYDLTRPTWVLWHGARALVQHSVWLLLLLLPIPMSLRGPMVLLAMGVGLFYSFAFIEDASERKIVQHGYPPWLARAIREETPRADREQVAELYAAYYKDGPGEAASRD